MLKPLNVWITVNWKILKEMGIQATLPASWKICMQDKKQQWELDMEQWTVFKLGKEYVKAVYHHHAYLTYMQSTSSEMPGWMKHKLESKFPGEISITSDVQMTPLLWQKLKRNLRASWWKWKRRVKSWLKTQHSKTLATWCKCPIHWKRPWCRERVKAEGEEGNRGWNGWMASLI